MTVSVFTIEASRLYEQARKQGIMSKIWSIVTRQSQDLLDLKTIQCTINVSNRHYIGIQVVPINQIRGSEGRSREFDRHFHPLQLHTKERWINMAIAQLEGRLFSTIELIQIGDIYFVRDGHHRISVAQILGQEQIEAAVTVWNITGTLPWESPVEVVCNDLVECPPLCKNVCV